MHEQRARDKPSRAWTAVQTWVADLLLIAGAALVAVGVGMIYLPAGLIAGGALAIVGGVLAARAEQGGDDG